MEKIIDYIRNNIGWFPFVFSLLMIWKIIGISIAPIDLIDYCLLISTSVYFLTKGGEKDSILTLFLLYIPLSILLANPNPVFKSWLRYGLFAMVLLFASPVIKGEKAKKFRAKVYLALLWLMVIVSALSFCCYFLGINYMRSQYSGGVLNYIENTAGTFGGLTIHSMLLGPVSGVASLFCFYKALTTNNKKYWYVAIMCVGSMLFSASRSAFISFIVGAIILLRFFATSGKSYLNKILIFFVLSAATYPVWNGAMDGIEAKNKGQITESINTSSREKKWQIRIEEFQSSPVWGIGFAAVSPKDNFSKKTGIIEPGSSWLVVLSMTGIIGFVLFGIIYLRAMRNSLSYKTSLGTLYASILTLVGIHMIAEGHIFSGGSFLCILVWLTIGCSTDYNLEIINEEEI